MKATPGIALAILLALGGAASTLRGQSERDRRATPQTTLLVVRAGDESVVPHPTVTLLDHRAVGSSVVRVLEFLRDGDPRAQPHLQMLRGDAEGRVTLPPGPGRVSVACESAGLFGIETLDLGEVSSRLALHPDRQLRVRVLRFAGRPTGGAKVQMCTETPEGDPGYRAQDADDQGMVVFRHAQVHLQHGAGEPGVFTHLADTTSVSLWVRGYFEEQPEARAVLDASFEGPVQLMLPPCNRLEVQVHGPDGSPYRESCLVGIVVEGSKLDLQYADHHQPFNLVADTATGRSVFFLDPSQTVRIGAWPGNQEYKGISARSSLAKTPGEDIEVTLAFTEQWPILLGRAVDGQGRPLRDQYIDVGVVFDDRAYGKSGTTLGGVDLDRYGRFRLPLSFVGLFENGEELLWIELKLGDMDKARPTGRIDLSRKYPPGPTEIGDVVVDLGATIVSGRVIDETGAPVAGATVSILEGSSATCSPRDRAWLRAIDPNRFQVTTDPDGAFLMAGEPSRHEMMLCVSHEDFLAFGGGIVEAGTEGLRVVLAKEKSLEASLLLDPDIDPADLEVWLVGGAAETPWWQAHLGWDAIWPFLSDRPGEADGRRATVDARGAFRWTGLRPETGRLEVRSRDCGLSLHTIPDIEVGTGGALEDPRLHQIDLRGKLRYLTLNVVAAGASWGNMPRVRLLPLPPGEPCAHSVPLLRDRVLVPEPTPPLLGVAYGYRCFLIPAGAATVKTSLEPGISVRLALPAGLPAPPEGCRVEARMELLRSTDPLLEAAGRAKVFDVCRNFPPSGGLWHRVPSPGTYRVSLRLVGTASRAPVPMTSGDSATFQVVESPDDQVLTLPVHEHRWVALLGKLPR